MTSERLKPAGTKENNVNPKIKNALDWVERNYKVPRNQMMILSGGALSLLLANIENPHFRPTTDIDILINPAFARHIPELDPYKLDIRSVPWGLVYLNHITTIASNGVFPQIDLLSEMYHAHLPENNDDPLSGFIYRFPVESAFNNPYKIRGIKVMPPEFIILYKLLQWRNGDYSGWDRTKRDVEDIWRLITKGLVPYDQVINTICKYVPDVEAQQVLVNRLNTASYCGSPTKIGVRQPNLLTPERQWGTPQINDQLKQAFIEFIKSRERCGRILSSGKLTIIN